MGFIKKTARNSIDRLLYDVLGTKQKEFISGLFTQKQKESLKKILKPGNKRTQLKKIERNKYRLYDLGFVQKGLEDLQQLAVQTEKPFLRKKAAWELAVYYANQYNKENATKSLRYIEEIISHTEDATMLRRAAILQAESLQLLGKHAEAKGILKQRLASDSHADLYLAYANLVSDVKDKLHWINKVFAANHLSEIALDKDATNPYDRLTALPVDMLIENRSKMPKVSIIMPVYNAGESVCTAIDSVLNQTWTNIELLIVDDCSTDDTKEVIQSFLETDNRVKLLSTPRNSGAYTARNIALKQATGDFITINDADDWSHPEKIKTQVTHLINNPKIIGNFSQQARLTNQLQFYRRGKGGIYIFSNMSSFMFRQKPVTEKLGYWDSVRFAGDSEFVKRVKLIFGEKAVVHLATSPLSFQRQSSESLTGSSAFGFPGFFMGARKEYAEAHEYYHKNHPDDLYIAYPQEKRLFPIPYPMLPARKPKSVQRHFDIIIASEFRLSGGTNMSNIEEIKAQRENGLKTGLIQMYRYDLNSAKDMNPKVRALIDGDKVQMLVYGENVSCDVLIVRHPPVLQEQQKYIPNVEAKHVCVIVNQPPKRDYSEQGVTLYDFGKSANHLGAYFGKKGIWYPIGPQIRQALEKYHSDDLGKIHLSEDDWVNIINVREWKRTQRLKHEKIVIGRHSRDQYVKWPDNPKTLQELYPDKANYDVYVLGGASAPRKVLGEIPGNWHVWDFGEMEPATFLKQLDVFVYFTNPNWVEAFGRVIFEAMAVGVPVILPPVYKPLFGEAAIYTLPEGVQTVIEELISDPKRYASQVQKAWDYVESNFGYAKHIKRLEAVSNAVE